MHKHLPMPYPTAVGPTYDCGNFPQVFERALKIAGDICIYTNQHHTIETLE